MSHTIGSCCVSGHLHDGQPQGSETTLAGLPTYVAKPDDGSKKKSLIFISDIFGYKLRNVRILADEYAKAGFYVYIPDILEGDYIDENLMNAIIPKDTAPPKTTVETVSDTAKTAVNLGPWIVKHREAVTKPLVDKAIKAVRDDAETGKIGVVGFCFGARYTMLAATEGSVDAAVALHPSFTTPEEFGKVTKPLAIGVGDKDAMFSVDQIEQTKKLLSENKSVQSEVVVYPGAHHGFSVRGDINNETEKKQKDEVAQQAFNWFNKFLA